MNAGRFPKPDVTDFVYGTIVLEVVKVISSRVEDSNKMYVNL